MTSNFRLRKVAKAYCIAKETILRQGYCREVDWQYEVSLSNLTEQIFLRETAWVILNSGMRETVVRQKFGGVSRAFFQWMSADQIIEQADVCRERALCYFGHRAKMDAIVNVAFRVSQDGFSKTAQNIKSCGLEYLRELPYIGPITSFHLAKNLGLPFAKPDRHLSRIANDLGYPTVQRLCDEIASVTDDPVPVIDIVLWRYSTIRPGYVKRFCNYINRDPDDMSDLFTSDPV